MSQITVTGKQAAKKPLILNHFLLFTPPEIISKILLLAKDKQIKDPTILDQILPRG